MHILITDIFQMKSYIIVKKQIILFSSTQTPKFSSHLLTSWKQINIFYKVVMNNI